MNRILIVIVIILFFTLINSFSSYSQKTNNISDTIEHSPRKAATMSLIIPGLGQAYNRQYYKIPIIYGLFTAFIYYGIDYSNKYKSYKQGYFELSSGDTINRSYINLKGYYEGDPNNTERFKRAVDYYKKWRDFNHIGIVAVYLLNIIEANVSAYFFQYDVSEQLTIKVNPEILNNHFAHSYGLRCIINF